MTYAARLQRPPPAMRVGVASATLLLAAIRSTPALAETLGQAGDDGISLWRVAFALVLCLGLAIAGAFALKGRLAPGQAISIPFFAGATSRRMKLIETLRVKHQVELCLVTCDGHEMLVLTSKQGAQVLNTAAGSHSSVMPTPLSSPCLEGLP